MDRSDYKIVQTYIKMFNDLDYDIIENIYGFIESMKYSDLWIRLDIDFIDIEITFINHPDKYFNEILNNFHMNAIDPKSYVRFRHKRKVHSLHVNIKQPNIRYYNLFIYNIIKICFNRNMRKFMLRDMVISL